MSSKKVVKAWLAISLLITLAACLPSRQVVPTPTPLPPPVTYEKTIYTVERGPIVSQFDITGKILPSKQEELLFRAPGYVSRVVVQEGDLVKAGDLLAELQVDDLLKQLEQAYIDLEVAQTKLSEEERPRQYAIARAEHQIIIRQLQMDLAGAALLESDDPSNQMELSVTIAEEQLARLRAREADYDADVLIARINLAQAEEVLAEAQIEYQEALDRPWEKDEVRDRYARALQQAEWNHEIVQARYAKALAAREVFQHDLRVQELAVEQAKAQMLQAQDISTTTLELQLQLAEENLALAQLDLEELSEEASSSQQQAVERAQLSVERLLAQLADRQIVAPFDGIVLLPSSGRALRPGDQVDAFRPVLAVGDPTELVIGVRRSEGQVSEIREDMEVYFSLSSTASKQYEATLLTGFLPFGETEEDEMTRQKLVYFSMPSPPERDLIPVGKTVYLTVILGRNDDTLLLHPATVRSFRGRDFVIVQEGDRQRRVDIQLGLETDDRVEVVGDLNEGDQVVGP